MAIRKLPSGSWQIYWNNPYTRRRESTTAATEFEAQKKDALVKYKLQFERESFMPAEVEKPAKLDSLEEVFKAYLVDRIHTKTGVEWQLYSMRTALSMYAETPVSDMTADDINRIKTAETVKGVKGVTIAGRMRVLRTLLRWAVKHGYMDAVPEWPEMPPLIYEKLVPPTPAEIRAMLDVAPEHIKRVIILGSQMGIRVGPSELLRLRWSDVDIKRKVVRVPSSRKNPREPWREVPIREELLPMFEKWKETDASTYAVYVVNRKGKQIGSIKKAWALTLKKAGITRRIRPYDLRHTFATEAIAAGVDIGTVASLMGHTDPTMLLNHYQHVMTRQKIAAVEALPHVHEAMCMKERGSQFYQ